MHRNSLLLFDRYARGFFEPGMRVLEIGGRSGKSFFERLVNQPAIRWETLDLSPGPDITWTAVNEYCFPFEDGEFDVVFSANVIEHVRKTWLWVRENARVCRTGGAVITINPVNWPYHESPIDCWRIFPEGMQALYSDAGLDIELTRSECLETRSLKFPIVGSPLATVFDVRRRLFGRHAPFLAIDTITIGRKP